MNLRWLRGLLSRLLRRISVPRLIKAQPGSSQLACNTPGPQATDPGEEGFTSWRGGRGNGAQKQCDLSLISV